MPIILIGIAVVLVLTFTNPLYQSIGELKIKVSSYDEALSNSKALEIERDKLSAKYKAINPENLSKLEKLLPENVDNIRLILEIEKIASPYGMALKDVKYDDEIKDTGTKASTPKTAPVAQGGSAPAEKKDYGTWNLEFSTTATYDNFISFVQDLESNLRIVDISSVEFSSVESGSSNSTQSSTPVYKYVFKIKTYWLKN
ncbi:MAG: hypothetical protein KBD55_01860 [Candidatus Pacebacteria bacterium]|nr:hypothetical protein [Candidatus Paceibacterota bacterium]